LKTFHIYIKGIVQGVGFRPFVYKIAKERDLKGWVNNTSNGVHIHVNTDRNNAKNFVETIKSKAPKLAIITQIEFQEIDFIEYHDFNIVHSTSDNEANLLLTPDFAMCMDCKDDIYSKNNSRFKYPFTTCTNCGPRYSITRSLPYDRETTTMDPFVMCSSCLKEYHDPVNRRYYSQTNSCPNCAIEMTFWEKGITTTNFTDLDYIVEQWNNGKIIAIKGIGGYLLTCDATNEESIKRLRARKDRPSKPFALMYHNIYELAEDVTMDICEKLELENEVAPIVLLTINDDPLTPLCFHEIAPQLKQIGVMIPYTPLYELLLSKFGKPIIATSGNISNSTIVYQDQQVESELRTIADGIASNNREIVVPQDDSVIRYSPITHQKIIIRRSRGMAPSYINSGLDLTNNGTILSFGAMLKSTFTLLVKENIFISQYLGNTDHLESQENFKNTLDHFHHLFNPEVGVVLVDKHPGYFSSIYGKELAINNSIPYYEIQHHKAHFYAVLGEHNLVETNDKILGVVWDGTGLGDDGNIWGGEFFLLHNAKLERVHHIDEFPFILGDKMPKEPRISALAICSALDRDDFIKEKFSDTEWKIYQRLLQKESSLKSTSVGRFFDAAASIILGVDFQTYEGEAAMQLESAAHGYFWKNNITTVYSYINDEEIPERFTEWVMKQIVTDIEKGFDKEFIAAKFHISLAHYIALISKQQQTKKVAFSGGVFQNQWLVELIIQFMGDDHELYFHKELSPNDECISFGQLMYYLYHAK
jgi:hydrogenase maturation protein HypF